MIWGSFGREGSHFLENAGRIHRLAGEQRHLPQTLCHIIGMWKLYKSGMVRVNQMHKLQEFFQTDHFFSEFSRYDVGTAHIVPSD